MGSAGPHSKFCATLTLRSSGEADQNGSGCKQTLPLAASPGLSPTGSANYPWGEKVNGGGGGGDSTHPVEQDDSLAWDSRPPPETRTASELALAKFIRWPSWFCVHTASSGPQCRRPTSARPRQVPKD